jgi:hypothetical protein
MGTQILATLKDVLWKYHREFLAFVTGLVIGLIV